MSLRFGTGLLIEQRHLPSLGTGVVKCVSAQVTWRGGLVLLLSQRLGGAGYILLITDAALGTTGHAAVF